MKVYVVKELRTWRYLTETRDFINDLRQADLFLTYELAKHLCPSGCEVVECDLMETTDLADHDKQVRKEVVEEIRKQVEERKGTIHNRLVIDYYTMKSILDQIQGDCDEKINSKT